VKIALMKLIRGRTQEDAKKRLAYLLIFPAFGYIVFSMLSPLIWSFYTTFTDKTIGSGGAFIGIQNYIDVLSNRVFWVAVKNTLIFTLGSVFFKIGFGMLLALILNESIRGKNVYRALLLLPWTIPNVVSVLTWQWIFSDVGGVFNNIMMNLGIINAPLGWLSNPRLAMVSIVIVNIWRGTPFLALTLLSGLQTISGDLYEAARIDGAGVFQRFINITLPGVKNVLVLGSLVTTVWTLNNFEGVWLMTGGGPLNSTQIIATLSYSFAFQSYNISKALTVSAIAFPFILLLVRAATKYTLDRE